MAENLFIQLIARLNKSLSRAQIQTDLKDIEKTPFYVRMIGRLNRSLTRRNIENDVQIAARNINVDINARVSERELQRSFDRARQNLESRIQNNPIDVPVNIDTEDIRQGQQQIHNLNNEAIDTRSIFSEYLNAREIFRAVTNAIKEAVNEVKELNKAQTDLQIVTGKSNAEMVSLMGKYNELAKDMSVTTKNITSSADEWLRQGKSVAETNELIKDSVILSKVGQIDAAEATKYLTSAMNGFKAETSDVIGIVDKLTNVDLESATSAGGLAEAMSKCANSADVAGVSMDALIGYIATVAEVTQKSDSVVGESFKTILARMGKIKLNNWIDEDGKDISGEINDVEKTLAQFDIKLRKSATEFRNFEDVIYDVGMAWDKFSSVDQNAIANAFGGVYQRENVITLFENFNRALELSEVSANSAGTAYQKFEVYENSLEAATNRLTAAFESLAYNTINSDFLTGLANATAGIVEFVDNTKLIQTGLTATLFTGVISGLVALGARMIVVRNNITQFTQAMNLSRSSTAMVGAQYNALRNSVNGLTEAQLRLVLSSRQLTEAQRLRLMQDAGIEQARQRQLLQTWNLTNATNAQTAATFSLRGAWEGLKASIATNPIGLIVTALTLATTAVITYNQKQEEIRQAAIDSANALSDQEKAIEDLKQSYIDIVNSEKSASEKTEELNSWKQELIDTYGFEKEAIEKVNLEREKSLDLLDKEIEKQNHEARSIWLENNKDEINKARAQINYGTDGSATMPYFKDKYYSDVSESVKNLWDSFAPPANMIEEYDQIGKIIAKLSDKKTTLVGLNEDEANLLDELTKQYKTFGDILEKDKVLYEKSYIEEAKNIFDNYAVDDNSIEKVSKETYLAWKNGLINSANGDRQLEKELRAITEKNFAEYESYYNNLDLAKTMFVEGKFNAKPISDYIESLSDEKLAILVQLDENAFDNGIEGVEKAIADFNSDTDNTVNAETDTSSLDDLKKAYENASKSADSFIKNQKSLTTVLDEQKKHGQLSASTIRELSEAGYSEALVTDKVTGAVTLDVQAYERLNAQKQEKIRLDLVNEKNSLEDKLKDEETAVSDLRQEYEALAKADMEANAGRLSEITLELAKRGANIEDIRGLISQINGDITSLTAPSFENDNTDKNKEAFDKLYSQWNHDLEMNKVTQDEYINWLDGAYKHYFSDLTKYQDEYNKYEEEVYKYRTDREQELFDKKIDNLEKLADKALDSYKDGDGNKLTITASFDYARDQINKAITETQARIDGIKNGTISGNTDDIETLIDDLDSLYDKLIDINKKEIESEKDYISELKDDYSDMMDERIDKVDELSDKIEKSYDKQIDAIDKQIDELEKVKDTEDRIKKIKDAQLAVKEKEQALDEAKREDAKNNYVYFDGTGMSVQTSNENQKKAQKELDESKKDLEEAYREEEINVLKDQKDILEEQKDTAKDYYDNVKDNLEKQKTQGEKTYEAVEKIYEQLGGDKKQTSSNVELVKKLSKSGDISKAMSELSDSERQKVIDTGVVKVQPNGDYTFDYSAFEKYSSTVDDNTLATQDLTSILKDIVTQADTDKDKTDNSMVAGGFNLVADHKTGKLTKKQVMVNGEVVEGLGHKVYATSKEEWQEYNNSEKASKGSFAGYDTFIDFMRAVSAGKVDISPLTNAFNSDYNPIVDRMNKSVSDTINNVSNSNVNNNINNKPIIQQTIHIDGSADKKTIAEFRNVAATEITNAFNQLNRKLDNTKF
jgi:TP901 family phage tail tape measure protein